MDKQIANVFRYVGYTGIGLMLIGVFESVVGFGAEFASKGFMGYLKGVMSFNGADTLMVGIWLVLATPIAGLVCVVLHGLKVRNYRLVLSCVVICLILSATVFISE